jgi:uncharacterized protein YjbI with pentapeptide repeats
VTFGPFVYWAGALFLLAGVVSALLEGVGLLAGVAGGLFLAILAIAFPLWRSPHTGRSRLGSGLLSGLVVAAAVGFAQIAVDERLDDIRQEQEEAQRRQTFLILINLQRDLSSIDLAGEDLTELYLRRKILRRARLEATTMDRAILRGAVLQRTNLRDASLVEADLTKAEGVGANFCGGDLTRADLDRTDLWRSNLHDAEIENADLRGADLRNADLEVKGGAPALSNARLTKAKYDRLTDLPATFDPRGAGMTRTRSREPPGVDDSRFRAKCPRP